jgi:hypothetical protein
MMKQMTAVLRRNNEVDFETKKFVFIIYFVESGESFLFDDERKAYDYLYKNGYRRQCIVIGGFGKSEFYLLND